MITQATSTRVPGGQIGRLTVRTGDYARQQQLAAAISVPGVWRSCSYCAAGPVVSRQGRRCTERLAASRRDRPQIIFQFCIRNAPPAAGSSGSPPHGACTLADKGQHCQLANVTASHVLTPSDRQILAPVRLVPLTLNNPPSTAHALLLFAYNGGSWRCRCCSRHLQCASVPTRRASPYAVNGAVICKDARRLWLMQV